MNLNPRMQLEINPAGDDAWESGARAKCLLIAINVEGYYSAPVRQLALICAQSNLLKERFDTRFTELSEKEISEAFIDRLVQWSPAIIGFSVNIWNRDHVFAIARQCKARLLQVCILCGGQEVTGSCVDYLAMENDLDFIIDGEGEIPLQQFLANFDIQANRLKDAQQVSGLHYREDNQNRFTRPAENVQNLDELPSPILAGMVPTDDKQKLGVLIEGTRGCPFRCAFCFEGSKKGKSRTASIKRLISEIDFMVGQGATYFHIMDPILCQSDIQHLKELTDYIASLSDKDRKVVFSVEAYAEHISPQVAQCLKSCAIIDVGLQSIHAPTLKAINRKYVPEKYQAGLDHLRQAGVSFNLYLICGLPHETLDSYFKGLRYVIGNRPTRLFLNELCLLNGTALRRDAEKHGYRFNPTPPYYVEESAWINAFELQFAHAVSKIVEKRYNLSAEGVFLKYPWLPEQPIEAKKHYRLPVPSRCSNSCPGCAFSIESIKGIGPDMDWEGFQGADIDILAGDSADKEEVLRTVGRLRLYGASRIGVVAPPALFWNADFLTRLVESGVWFFRTFLRSEKKNGQSSTAEANHVHKAVENLSRPFQLHGKAKITPFMEVVVQSDSFSQAELEDQLAELILQKATMVTLPDSDQHNADALADLFKNHLGSQTWLQMPESMMKQVLASVRQPAEVMAHLQHFDMLSTEAWQHPPCFQTTDGSI